MPRWSVERHGAKTLKPERHGQFFVLPTPFGTRPIIPPSGRVAVCLESFHDGAGMAAARARGRSGGRPYKMTAAKLRLAMASMAKPERKAGELCAELGVTRQTLYLRVGPDGTIRPDERKLLGAKGASSG